MYLNTLLTLINVRNILVSITINAQQQVSTINAQQVFPFYFNNFTRKKKLLIDLKKENQGSSH